MRYLMLVFIIAFTTPAFSEDKAEWWLINGAWSHHFKEGDYNETHGAIGIQYKRNGFVAAATDLTLGDSYKKDASYFGVGVYSDPDPYQRALPL